MGQLRGCSRSTAVLIVLLMSCGGRLLAQDAGEVEGQVQDGQGQALNGVTIELLKAGSDGASRKQTSDAQGNFRFNGLATGVYIAAASRDGYAEVTCPGVRVMSGLTRRLAIKLMPAEGEQPSTCEAASDTAQPAPPPPK